MKCTELIDQENATLITQASKALRDIPEIKWTADDHYIRAVHLYNIDQNQSASDQVTESIRIAEDEIKIINERMTHYKLALTVINKMK